MMRVAGSWLLALALVSRIGSAWVQAGCEGLPGNGGGGGGTEVPQSRDPNELAGPYGEGDPDTQRFVMPGQWMDYIVYFENLSNATAAAQEVWVENPLSAQLDWSTFELGEVVFANQSEMGLAGRKGGTLEVQQAGTSHNVRVTFALNPTNGLARWYLRVVDPDTSDGWPSDPYAGFLPPNDETHRGEGRLAYRVKVCADAPAGTTIRNAATIVFDYNAPITTDPDWWNIVAGDAPGAVSGGVPSNSATILSLQPTLAWEAASLAENYELYLWPSEASKPAEPSATNVVSTFYVLPAGLVAVGDSWNWQVMSRNQFGASNGPVWSFSVRALRQFAITAQAGANGRIEPSGQVPVTEGDSLFFTITPDTYYHIARVNADTNELGAVASYFWRNAATNGLLRALFAANLTTNNVPEWWLARHGWTNNFAAAALADPDGDAMPTWEEFMACTDPTNAASRFALTRVERLTNGAFRLRWLPLATEQRFGVDEAAGLDRPWNPAASNLNTNEWVTVPGGGVTSRFFRVNVLRPTQ